MPHPADDARHLALFHEAVRRTDALIERGHAPAGKSQADIRARAEQRLANVRSLLADLGDPHRGYPIVHIGGTSGKGSTSVLLAEILSRAGYRTGLHISPYLQTPTEKLQIDGRLIAPGDFADLVDEVLAAGASWSARTGIPLTYGEIWIALVFTHLARHRVDIAVIEVGAGGRYDMTNVVDPALSVITSIGLDHQVTLGDTIPEIAWHKAGIIKPGRPALTAVVDPQALPVIEAEARMTGSRLGRVVPGITYQVLEATASAVRWRELPAHPDGPGEYGTTMPGRFQAANAATAVAAARALAEVGIVVPAQALADGVRHARIPGRAELVQREPRVLLDGAHNPQKVGALAQDLPELLPLARGGRRIVVLGMLDAKDPAKAIDALAPHAGVLIVTAPHVLAKPAHDAAQLAALAAARGFAGEIVVEPDPRAAVDRAMAMAGPGDAVVVTGSLYLVGNVRGIWQPDDAVILAQSPWPRPLA
jgi:dihydrofolate synthase/folylpolyglutamate synthase